ncbi:MAG: cell division protein FtsQ/DivIB [Anaerovoracaceae bacterium]|jgi:cell division protein FtsQ
MDRDERDRNIPDTKGFEEQYGREMREELQRMKEAEAEAKAAAEEEEPPAEESEEYYEEPAEEPYVSEPQEEEPPQEAEEPEDEEPSETKKKQPRRKKHRKKKHGFLWFCIIIALLVAGIIFLNSSYFAIDKITVKGNENYSANDIVKMSGVEFGTNIFHVFGHTVEKNLKKNSYVKSAGIERKLPGELVIRLKEREPVAYLPYGSQYAVIDEKGYVINVTGTRPELTEISGMKIKSMTPGTRIEADQTRQLEKAISIIQLMKKGDLFFKRITLGKVVMQAYVYDDLVCRGTPQNIKRNMRNGNLQKIIYDLYKKDVKKGTINIGSGKYCSYSPRVE